MKARGRRAPSRDMSSVDDDLDIEILEEDQQKICRFSCLNNRSTGKEALIAQLNEELQKLVDAEEEVTLAFGDDDILLKVGQSFINCPHEDVQQFIEQDKIKKKAELTTLQEEVEELSRDLQSLKASLYAKFGQRIYLEK
ncbi:prefoldin subunit protein [Cardiosporidium cionae]|uniref:Prefoldin subunit 4 n=1 Tax=Cardiosporidium cionae TaxID=476202 RepID=A0ABQ7J9I8_9APIC|nr:prefoldin subunit protein [Cardiosporidium cionae]|eukprot:KAF8820635.1 prefoldin subunit protein [Cardiosporidium cionae]